MTIEELGKKTKTKYSQYSGLSDREVGEKVLAKYPEYQSQIDDRNVLQKFGDFLSKASPTIANLRLIGSLPELAKRTGETERATEETLGLIRRARATQDPQEAERLREQASQLGQPADELQQQIETTQRVGAVSDRDLERSTEEFALRRGLAQAFETGSFLAPQTTAFQSLRGLPGVATAGQRIAGAGLAGALPGVFSGLTQASLTAEDIKEGGVDVLEGSLVGGLTGAVFQTVPEFSNWVKESKQVVPQKIRKIAKSVYSDTLKDNVKDLTFYKQAGGRDQVVEDSIRLRIPNTKQGVQRELVRYGDEYGSIVDDALARSEKAGQKVSVVKFIEETRDDVLNRLNRPETRTQYKAAKNYFDDAIKTYGKNPDNTWADANDLRKFIDSEVGGQVLSETDQGRKYALKQVASKIRNAFKDNFPELKDPIKRYQLLSGLSDAFRKEPVFGLPEITLTATGAVTAGGPGGLTGLLGGIAARSPGLRRATAGQVLRSIPERTVEVTRQAVQPSRLPQQATPLMGAIQRALRNESQSKQEQRRLP